MPVLVAIVGLLLGGLVTAFTLLRDPLAMFESAVVQPIVDPAQLVTSSEISRGLSVDPTGILGFESGQLDPFIDSALRYARLDIVLLDSADGGARALAVKLSAPRADNSLLRGQLVADSAWNLIWPGHGSLFLVGRADYRPLLADQVWNAATGNGFKGTSRPHAISIAPRLLGSGGRLAVAAGTYREYWNPDAGDELELGLTEN
jgi:hypothetical protein